MNNNTNNKIIHRWWEETSKKQYGGGNNQNTEVMKFPHLNKNNIVMKNDQVPLDYVQRVEGIDYNVRKEWHPLLKASLKFLNDATYKGCQSTLKSIDSSLHILETDPLSFKLKDLKKGFEFKTISRVLELAPANKKEHLYKKYNALYEKVKGGKALDLSYNITIIGQNKKIEYTSLDVYQITNYLLKKCRLIKGRPTLEVLKYQKVGRYFIPAELSYKNDRIILSIKTSL